MRRLRPRGGDARDGRARRDEEARAREPVVRLGERAVDVEGDEIQRGRGS